MRSYGLKTIQFAGALGCSLSIVAPDNAEANELVLQPRVEFGILDYDFSFDDVVLANGSVGDGLKISDTLFMGGLGGLIFYKGFFIDLAARISTEGSDDGQQFITDIVGNTPVAATHDYESTFQRSEFDILFGYAIPTQSDYDLSLYVGYRYAETNFETDTTTVGSILNAAVIAPFDEVFDGTFDVELTYSGPYVGMTVGVPMPLLPGRLSVTPILAFFDGEFRQNFEPAPGARVPTLDSAEADGTSLGFNVGVEWAVPFDNGLEFSIGVDRSQFEFKTDGDGVEGDFEESFNRARVKLKYLF